MGSGNRDQVMHLSPMGQASTSHTNFEHELITRLSRAIEESEEKQANSTGFFSCKPTYNTERAQKKRALAQYVIERVKDIDTWYSKMGQMLNNGPETRFNFRQTSSNLTRLAYLLKLYQYALAQEDDLNSVVTSLAHGRFPGSQGVIYNALNFGKQRILDELHLVKQGIVQTDSYFLQECYPGYIGGIDNVDRDLLGELLRTKVRFINFDYEKDLKPTLPIFGERTDDDAEITGLYAASAPAMSPAPDYNPEADDESADNTVIVTLTTGGKKKKANAKA